MQIPGCVYCPSCHNAFVHHFQIDVYERDQDAQEGLHIQVLGVDTLPARQPSFTTDNSLEGNPSYRRQGITIHFRCERCHSSFVMKLMQHKGCTLLDIGPTSRDSPGDVCDQRE